MKFRYIGVLLVSCLLVLLAGCTFTQQSASVEDLSGDVDDSSVTSTNNAIVALLDNAAQQYDTGQLESASATLERALRIEPRNPYLWHRLAEIRFEQGQYNLAANLAAKSNSFAASSAKYNVLIDENREIISQAKRKMP